MFDTKPAMANHVSPSPVSGVSGITNPLTSSVTVVVEGQTLAITLGTTRLGHTDQRVKAIRDSLIQPGVSADGISTGMFGAVELRRDRCV